eukprot:4013713-Prymnesium_polylepis.1
MSTCEVRKMGPGYDPPRHEVAPRRPARREDVGLMLKATDGDPAAPTIAREAEAGAAGCGRQLGLAASIH